jgi:hypothetical protein
MSIRAALDTYSQVFGAASQPTQQAPVAVTLVSFAGHRAADLPRRNRSCSPVAPSSDTAALQPRVRYSQPPLLGRM